VSQYDEEPTPGLDQLQQEGETDGGIEVPVKVREMPIVQVHPLPARDAVMRSVVATTDNSTQQLVGLDLRRKRITVWATSATADGVVYVGSDKNEVESGTASLFPAVVDTLANGVPMVVTMEHCMPLWVRNPDDANPVTVSYVAEYWAD